LTKHGRGGAAQPTRQQLCSIGSSTESAARRCNVAPRRFLASAACSFVGAASIEILHFRPLVSVPLSTQLVCDHFSLHEQNTRTKPETKKGSAILAWTMKMFLCQNSYKEQYEKFTFLGLPKLRSHGRVPRLSGETRFLGSMHPLRMRCACLAVPHGSTATPCTPPDRRWCEGCGARNIQSLISVAGPRDTRHSHHVNPLGVAAVGIGSSNAHGTSPQSWGRWDDSVCSALGSSKSTPIGICGCGCV